jgi:predicted ATP-grasp superfamily ATP-dependent carboligase
MSNQQVIVLGASARAACFSARRSGYSPYWIDQYGDHDLLTCFQGSRISTDNYPAGMLDLIDASPEVPFLYTGAIENHLQILEKVEKVRHLSGNTAKVCREIRDPVKVASCYSQAGIRHPQILPDGPHGSEQEKHYLLKPLHSSGGQGIAFYRAGETALTDENYLQEFISGESKAGIFIADGKKASLIGVTRQLTGEQFLHAAEFSYCGSVGPLPLEPAEYEQWQLIGNTLSEKFALKGLFGVDAVQCGRDIFPVEVNPRYTASVEVIERALELPLISMHCDACSGELSVPVIPGAKSMIAKAYLFAEYDLISPKQVQTLYDENETDSFSADIPHPETWISRGHPVMTVLVSAKNQQQAMQALKNRAKSLYEKFRKA